MDRSSDVLEIAQVDLRQRLLISFSDQRQIHLILLTKVPLDNAAIVRQVYADWSRRSPIEPGYRFDQQVGLDVEAMRVETLERMRRLFILVLLAAQFVCCIASTWPQAALVWLRTLGGKLGLTSDRDGLYVLLGGSSAVGQTMATLTFLANHPLPMGDLNLCATTSPIGSRGLYRNCRASVIHLPHSRFTAYRVSATIGTDSAIRRRHDRQDPDRGRRTSHRRRAVVQPQASQLRSGGCA